MAPHTHAHTLPQALWFLFPTVAFLSKFGLLDVATEEWVWCMSDLAGKIYFSSSLLYGNFLTIEQRRFISMRIVEESNRWGRRAGLVCVKGGAGLAKMLYICSKSAGKSVCEGVGGGGCM